ncbi:MAG TPA: four helix bundle protein [Pyrinomonadaceae bacterium]|nr:four helix bundle protein [Pyrinomonadaceae bacterium]
MQIYFSGSQLQEDIFCSLCCFASLPCSNHCQRQWFDSSNQLLDAGTSIGANLEEAQAGQSPDDFIHKNSISLKEARESNYWLKLILATESFDGSVKKGIEDLISESSELTKIIGKIIVSMKK